MGLSVKWLIYLGAALALVAAAVVYGTSGLEHEEEEAGLIEGDAVKVAVAVGALAVVAAISYLYLAKRPPEEGG